jgi:hypothetical protein
MKNYILCGVIVVSLSCVGAFALKGAGTLQEESRGEIIHTPIDCNKKRPQVRVRSSVDNMIYLIDVCAATESAEGEDFRTKSK